MPVIPGRKRSLRTRNPEIVRMQCPPPRFRITAHHGYADWTMTNSGSPSWFGVRNDAEAYGQRINSARNPVRSSVT